jgi:hypothetical protein
MLVKVDVPGSPVQFPPLQVNAPPGRAGAGDACGTERRHHQGRAEKQDTKPQVPPSSVLTWMSVSRPQRLATYLA